MFRNIVLIGMLALAGCRGSTEYGECVGIQDAYQAEQQHPDLEYKLSVRNTVLGIIFFQTIFAPVIWLAADFKCPVGRKQQ